MEHSARLNLTYLLARCTRGNTPDYRTCAKLLGISEIGVRRMQNENPEFYGASAAIVRLLEVLDKIDEHAPWLLDAMIADIHRDIRPPREREVLDVMERERRKVAEREKRRRENKRGW